MLPFMDLPLMVSVPGALALLLAYIRSRRSQVLRAAPASIRRLVWYAGNRWQLELRSGDAVNAALLPRVFIQPWLVILHFRLACGRKSRLVLLPDMLGRDEFRRLRVRLLIEMKQIICPAGS